MRTLEDGDIDAQWFYDANGRCTLSLGNFERSSIIYNVDGSRIIKSTLGGTELYVFTNYFSVPRVASIARLSDNFKLGATRQFTYDANGNISSATDWLNVTNAYTNDSHGQPTITTRALGDIGLAVTNSYCTNYHLLQTSRNAWQIVTNTYDQNGNLLVRSENDLSTNTLPYVSHGNTRKWVYGYYPNGKVSTITDPKTNIITKFGYDTNGYVSRITNALGHVTRITNSLLGMPVAVVDANGVLNTFSYDTRGRLTRRVTHSSFGNVTNSIEYNVVGDVFSITLGNGVKLSWLAYDHDVLGMTNVLGDQIAYARDAANNITAIASIENRHGIDYYVCDYKYDFLSQLVERNLWYTGEQTTFSYDANGNLTGITNGLGSRILQSFDTLNRLATLKDSLNNVTRYTYDGQGALAGVRDPRGLITEYVHDGFGRLVQEQSPDRGTTTYYWDNANNCIKAIDGRGVVTLRTFDTLNRITSQTYPASPSENLTYTYDNNVAGNRGIGKLTGFVDESGSNAFIYNDFGFASTNIAKIGGVLYKTSFVYDRAGNVSQIAYPSGHTVGFSRDLLGNVNGVIIRTNTSSAMTVLATNITYVPFGPINSLKYSNGVTHDLYYDLGLRIYSYATYSGSSYIQSNLFLIDAAANITGVQDALYPERTQSFWYDEDNRLIGGSGVYGAFGLTYDEVGNRQSYTANGTTETYNYTPTANRLNSIARSAQVRHVTTDVIGNLATDSRWTGTNMQFGYGNRNRLNWITNGNVLANYKYNALGRRILKTVSGVTTHFHYDLKGHLIAESTAAGSLIREYIWLDDMPLTQIEGSGIIYYIHPDHLNSPQKMTDSTGKIVWDREQMPFGEDLAGGVAAVGMNANHKFQLSAHGSAGYSYAIQAKTNLAKGVWSFLTTNNAPFSYTDAMVLPAKYYRSMLVSSSIKVTNNLRFPGQYFDSESGLCYNAMRDYDSSLGRYVEGDPIGLNGDINAYAYAGGNPVYFIDPFGFSFASSWSTSFAVGGAVLAGGASVFLDYASGGINIVFSPGEVAAGGTYAGLVGWGLGSIADGIASGDIYRSEFPPGYLPAPVGSRQWGRRNGFDAEKAGRAFHNWKGKCPGSGPDEDYGVNPETGDIIDQNGEGM